MFPILLNQRIQLFLLTQIILTQPITPITLITTITPTPLMLQLQKAAYLFQILIGLDIDAPAGSAISTTLHSEPAIGLVLLSSRTIPARLKNIYSTEFVSVLFQAVTILPLALQILRELGNLVCRLLRVIGIATLLTHVGSASYNVLL